MQNNFPERMRRKQVEEKKINYSLMAGLLVLCASFGLYFIFQFSSVQRSYLYPYPYQDEVRACAEAYQVDSDLVMAVIKAESNFNQEAVSHRGAMGLMQIMPSTAEWIAEQMEDGSFSREKLFDPELNIRYGIWYLAELQKEFDDNTVLVLMAYNAGRGTVKAWMEENHWDMSFHNVEAIPFGETREYVKRVMKHREKYRKLYH